MVQAMVVAVIGSMIAVVLIVVYGVVAHQLDQRRQSAPPRLPRISNGRVRTETIHHSRPQGLAIGDDTASVKILKLGQEYDSLVKKAARTLTKRSADGYSEKFFKACGAQGQLLRQLQESRLTEESCDELLDICSATKRDLRRYEIWMWQVFSLAFSLSVFDNRPYGCQTWEQISQRIDLLQELEYQVDAVALVTGMVMRRTEPLH